MKLKSGQNAKAELTNRRRCKVRDPFALLGLGLSGHTHRGIGKIRNPLFFSYHRCDGSSGANELANGKNGAGEKKARVITAFRGGWKDGDISRIKKWLKKAAEVGCLRNIVGEIYDNGGIEDLIRIARKVGCLGYVLKGAYEDRIFARVAGTIGLENRREIIIEACKVGLDKEVTRLFGSDIVKAILSRELEGGKYIL